MDKRSFPMIFTYKQSLWLRIEINPLQRGVEACRMRGIYLIHCDMTTYYKIGIYTDYISDRLISLQSGCPFNLVVIHKVLAENSEEIEKYLHKRWVDKRVRGEWFDLHIDDTEEIIEDMDTLAEKQVIDWSIHALDPKKKCDYGKVTDWHKL